LVVPAGRASVHPEAIAEARAARKWYHGRNAEAAEAFMAELDVAIERIEDAPQRVDPAGH
jgi:ParE toxin of type II toxin-antitoxin system, parDE